MSYHSHPRKGGFTFNIRGGVLIRKSQSGKEKENSGMDIPDYAIERMARCLLPMIRKYYESEEGQQELAAWEQQENKQGHDD